MTSSMMPGLGLLDAYSAEVLGFGFKDADAPADLPAPPPPAELERLAGRVLAALARSGRRRLVLLGLGSGALAAALAESLSAGVLCVCEQDLALVRALRSAGRLGWWRPGGAAVPDGSDGSGGSGNAILAADSSPWALFLLLDRVGIGRAGIGLGDVLVLPNPELPPPAKAALRPLELLLTRSRPLDVPAVTFRPRLSAAAILSPEEPDLSGFFAQFPDWIHELALVWDAETVPGIPVPERFAVRQSVRPLGRDFSAQRNAMLAACTGDWVLYLDADERLAPSAWAMLPALCAVPQTTGVCAWHFPRLTPYPDAEHALMGFGLWPDVQLRLFRNAPTLRFVNTIHERLTGLAGAQALAPDVEIEHLSRLRKDAETLRRKLEGFDAASSGRVRHALSVEYPSLDRALLAAPGQDGPPRALLLPPEFA